MSALTPRPMRSIRSIRSIRPLPISPRGAGRRSAPAAVLLALAAASAGSAAHAQTAWPFGHPAVAGTPASTRAAGYDYASKFYRHPAGLDLAPTYEPHRHAGMEHPAVLAQRTAAGYDYASKFYRHPAGLDLAATYHVHAGQEHPAVLVKRAQTTDVVQAVATPHPALVARATRRAADPRVAAR